MGRRGLSPFCRCILGNGDGVEKGCLIDLWPLWGWSAGSVRASPPRGKISWRVTHKYFACSNPSPLRGVCNPAELAHYGSSLEHAGAPVPHQVCRIKTQYFNTLSSSLSAHSILRSTAPAPWFFLLFCFFCILETGSHVALASLELAIRWAWPWTSDLLASPCWDCWPVATCLVYAVDLRDRTREALYELKHQIPTVALNCILFHIWLLGMHEPIHIQTPGCLAGLTPSCYVKGNLIHSSRIHVQVTYKTWAEAESIHQPKGRRLDPCHSVGSATDKACICLC